MNKNKILIPLLIMVISGIFAFVGFTDAVLVFKDKRIDLNKSTIDDFIEPAIAEGDAYIVTGPFAEREEKNTVYGIPVGKKSTYYYVISTADPEEFEEVLMSETDNVLKDLTWYVASTSNKKMVEKLDAAAESFEDFWNDYVNFYDDLIENKFSDDEEAYAELEKILESIPSDPVEIGGLLKGQSTEDEYEKYRDNFLAPSDMNSSDLGEQLVLIENPSLGPGMIEVIIFFASVAVFLIGLIILIVNIAKSRKKKSEELW